MNLESTSEQIVADLFAFTDPRPGTVERLHRQLDESAGRAQILDVAYTTVDSPVGTLLLAATERGLLRVAFEIEGLDKVVNDLSRRVSPCLLYTSPSPRDRQKS